MILDDATSQIYYAQLVEEESTLTVLRALREVVEQEGIFCALYSDRASHFFWTPRAGGKVDPERRTQVGRALANCAVTVYEHLDGTLSIGYGAHIVGRYNAQGWPCLPEPKGIRKRREKAVEKTVRPGGPWKSLRDSHFPTATAAGLSQSQTGQITCSKKRTF